MKRSNNVKSLVRRIPAGGVRCEFVESKEWRGRDGKKLVICRRPGCRRFALTKNSPDKVFASCFHPQFKLGDAVKRFIERVTFGLVKPTPDCDCELRRKLLNLLFSVAVPDRVIATLQRLGFVRIPREPWENERMQAFLVRIGTELKNGEKIG